MTAAGFELRPGIHPIVPIMLGDARLAVEMARDLLDEGIYVIGFSFPVVPKGQARIRVQLSAAHTPGDGRPRRRGVREGGPPARRDPLVTAGVDRPDAAPVGPVTLAGQAVRLVPLEVGHLDALLAAANTSPEERFPFTWVPRDRPGMAA